MTLNVGNVRQSWEWHSLGYLQMLLAEEEAEAAMKEAVDQKSVSQKSEDYSLNLAEAVRVRPSVCVWIC